MFTVCPKCSLKLVVTAADLRVAQGYVRCGRCSNVFNALIGLSDELQSALAREELSDAALEFDPSQTDVSQVFIEARPDERSPTDTFESIILQSEAESPEESADRVEPPGTSAPADSPSPTEPRASLERAAEPVRSAAPDRPARPPARAAQPADRLAQPAERLAQPAERPAPPPARAAHADRPAQPIRPAQPGRAPQGERTTQPSHTTQQAPARAPRERTNESARAQVVHEFELEPLRMPREMPPQRSDAPPIESGGEETPTALIDRALPAGVALLAVLLAAQIVDHYRSDLVEVGWLRAPLTAVYAALGMTLTPRWDVTAYEVRQLGAVAGPDKPGALTVRASVKNLAPQPQPLPLLRVTMQDRFGNRVAARDVPPRAYLPKGSAERAYLAAGQRVDADIELVDPGPNAVGFEIDACLADAAGRVACANEQ
ncbi:MAG TPA: zinc-ribbon and DUF3426 domain-containing protein [Steroidobacteraceae bacterium]|nr:zinc-ribbon and DUF3426 domain-containing protein [Steroidobacteraceae bacterium]